VFSSDEPNFKGARMSSEATILAGLPAGIRVERLKSFRLIPRIETYPGVVSVAQTAAGKLGLLTCFGLLLWQMGAFVWLILPCLAATSFFPKHRHQVVMLSTIGYTLAAYLQAGKLAYPALFCVGIIFVCAMFLISAVVREQQNFVGRYALPLLFGTFTALILLSCYLPLPAHSRASLWLFTGVLQSYVWFIGYAVLDNEPRQAKELGLEVGSLQPFWGSTATPFPSGPACLRQIEAKDAEALAVTQLKGLKLLAWAVILSFADSWYSWFFHDFLKVPHFEKALYLSSLHTPLPWTVCWASLILYYFSKLLTISIWGHQIIACCRMAGFDALRNTYRPLSSTSVAEFFNRYYFYYKELLVYFFFFPTFLRLPSKLGKLRISIGIFVAACVGNSYYHFTRELGYIQQHGMWQSIKTFQVFFFYTVVLATAIAISRRRNRPDESLGFFRCTLRPAILVSVFYCLLSIFSTTDRNYPLWEHLRFLGHLFLLN
jgi:hypothetical protein